MVGREGSEGGGGQAFESVHFDHEHVVLVGLWFMTSRLSLTPFRTYKSFNALMREMAV